MTDCKVCSHPRAFEVMSKVFSGTLTYVDAATELRLPAPTVWRCFREHWQIETTESGQVALRAQQELSTTEDYVMVLRNLIKKFIHRLQDALENMPVSAYNESAVTRLSAELRGLMRDILEFEGKLKTAPLVQLNLLQVQFAKLTSFLFTELCEEDRQKLMKKLPELMVSEPIGTTAENPSGA